MDPKMPDIKADVNKIDEGKKKASGLLGLFGGGGASGAGGLGGLGAGAAGGGGLLATKAGMLALVLMGSAVAGGIGLAGYKIFGPGEADKTGGNLSLFAPKPQQTVDPNAVAPVNADGSSDSLNYAASAAAKDKAAEAPAVAASAVSPENAAGDSAQAAADAARHEIEAKAAAGGAINAGGGSGAVGSMGKGLANVKKLGALSGAATGGSSSASAGSSARPGENPAAARSGALSAFSRSGPGAKAGSTRGVGAGRGRSAMGDLRGVMGDYKTASRPGAGYGPGGRSSYDGATGNSGNAIGPDGSQISMGGPGGDVAGAQPKALAANSTTGTNDQTPPIPKAVRTVVPWEKAVERATMLIMLAGLLAYGASKIPPSPYTKLLLYAIGAAICALGVYIGVLAGQIISSPYGQKMQGMVVAAAALGVIATGVGVIMGGSRIHNNGGKPWVEGADQSTVLTNTASVIANPMVLLGGGVAIVAGIAMMFGSKPKPIELKDGEKKPDVRYERRANPARYMV